MTVLFAGDDWAADHHDAELMDQAGRTLARARLSEGAAGVAKPHALKPHPQRQRRKPAPTSSS